MIGCIKWHSLRTQDLKYEPWRSWANTLPRSRRLTTILIFYEWAGNKHVIFFETWIPARPRANPEAPMWQVFGVTTAPSPLYHPFSQLDNSYCRWFVIKINNYFLYDMAYWRTQRWLSVPVPHSAYLYNMRSNLVSSRATVYLANIYFRRMEIFFILWNLKWMWQY